MEEKEEKYLDYLLKSLERIKDNSINQQGSSDIEPPDYVERIEHWYSQLENALGECSIEFYVKELLIFEDDNREIKHIVFSYYTDDEPLNGVSITSRRVL